MSRQFPLVPSRVILPNSELVLVSDYFKQVFTLYNTSQNVTKWRLCRFPRANRRNELLAVDTHYWLLFYSLESTMVKSKKAALKLARKSAQAGPKHVKNNPFEIHTNKRKHDILGRKLKHDRGLPGISRSKAIKKVSSYGVFFKAWAILE